MLLVDSLAIRNAVNVNDSRRCEEKNEHVFSFDLLIFGQGDFVCFK